MELANGLTVPIMTLRRLNALQVHKTNGDFSEQ
jgi:hypothetical protein